MRVEIASGDPLDVRSFAITERVSELSRVEVRAVSRCLTIDFDEVVGKDASFELATATWVRRATGVVSEIEQVRVDEAGLATYRVVLVPRAWLMSQRKNYRIFQYLSELAIVEKLLGEWGLDYEARIGREHKPRKYRVQYDESDLDFVTRMLSDAGIAFFFETTDGGTKLVLDDQPEVHGSSLASLPFHDSPRVTGGDFVTRVAVHQIVRPGRLTTGDVDYRRPSSSQPRLSAAAGLPQEAALERFEHEPGAFLFAGAGGGGTPAADDRGTARTDEGAGSEKTRDRLAGLRGGARVVRLESNVLTLAPGAVFQVVGHPHRAVSAGTLLVVAASLRGEHDGAWLVAVEAEPTTAPHRPAPVAKKPKVPGLESATVVGPSGEEIHTDEFGRVRVQFHWDREGKRDETSSCWLPTSQPWAGTGFGGINLPRIGQEVLVEFLGGDPDRPVVIGRVYTETNPAPDKLPKHKSVSGIMSESTPRMVMGAADGGAAGAETSLLGGGTPMSPSEIHADVTQPGPYQAASPTGSIHSWNGSGIKFEDQLNSEIVYLQAQRDLNIRVNNCWRTIVGNNRACRVGTDDQLEVLNRHDTFIRGNQEVKVDGNQKLTVFEERAEYVQKTASLEIGAGGFHVSTDTAIQIQAKKGIFIEAKNRIELVVKGSKIEMLPGQITIKSGDKVFLQPSPGGHPK